MRITITLVLTCLLLTTACAGGSAGAKPACDVPQAGQVLSVCSGAVVISMGASDGVRPGDTLLVMRGGKKVAMIIIHEAKDTQAAGTMAGVSEQGGPRPGDQVIGTK